MSWLDKIPTLGEIIDVVSCYLSDHNWMELKFENEVRRVCKDCGKVEKVG